MKIGNRKSEIENLWVPRPPSLVPYPSPAFTLIELIIVIAIIGILTSLIFPIVGALDKKKKIAVAQSQLQSLETAIEGYKTKLGYYPPDNTVNPTNNPLYFELLGTTNDGAGKPAPTTWVTMDNSAQITDNGVGTGDIWAYFHITGLANTSTRAHSDDQGAAATTFINNLLPNQIGVLDPANRPLIKVLVCSVSWPPDKQPGPIPANPTINPFCYISTHPTNNTSTYDLWVDVVARGKTNRVCNWSTQPIQL